MPPLAVSDSAVIAVLTTVAWAGGAVALSAAMIVQVKVVAVVRPKPSVSVSVSDVAGATVIGVPEILPVAVSSASPAGSVPAVRSTRYDGTAVRIAGKDTRSPTAEV